MSGKSVNLLPPPAKAGGATTPAPRAQDSSAPAKATVTPSAGSEPAPDASDALGRALSHQAAAQSQLSSFTTAKADANVILHPGSGARPAKYSPPQCLELGTRGPEVYRFQLQLVRLGYLTPEDVEKSHGVYSEKTCEAVLSFQMKYGLEPNGIVEGETFHTMIQVELEEFDRKARAKMQSPRPAASRGQRPAPPSPSRAPAVPARTGAQTALTHRFESILVD